MISTRSTSLFFLGDPPPPGIQYLEGGPVRHQRRVLRAVGPMVETLIWWPGQDGWLSDIVEAAWDRWLAFYPGEWRSLGETVPHIHLRTSHECDRPRTAARIATERHERALLAACPSAPRSEWGHTHTHDHGICLDPDVVTFGCLERVLMHELVHAITGAWGHDRLWLAMCRVIGLTRDQTTSTRQEVPSDDGVVNQHDRPASGPPVAVSEGGRMVSLELELVSPESSTQGYRLVESSEDTLLPDLVLRRVAGEGRPMTSVSQRTLPSTEALDRCAVHRKHTRPHEESR